jgi:hypothetical protein
MKTIIASLRSELAMSANEATADGAALRAAVNAAEEATGFRHPQNGECLEAFGLRLLSALEAE